MVFVRKKKRMDSHVRVLAQVRLLSRPPVQVVARPLGLTHGHALLIRLIKLALRPTPGLVHVGHHLGVLFRWDVDVGPETSHITHQWGGGRREEGIPKKTPTDLESGHGNNARGAHKLMSRMGADTKRK